MCDMEGDKPVTRDYPNLVLPTKSSLARPNLTPGCHHWRTPA
jgi:hypothetical protein